MQQCLSVHAPCTPEGAGRGVEAAGAARLAEGLCSGKDTETMSAQCAQERTICRFPDYAQVGKEAWARIKEPCRAGDPSSRRCQLP